MTVETTGRGPVQLPSAGRVGQGTVIEQSRAAAEVAAAVHVAQENPRNMQAAIGQMQQSCRMQTLADRAFFRFSRGGSAVSGASVHLARELARCWGNVQYGLVELRRDDEAKQSEMQAFAWDVETNTRNSSTFIVPHIRDTRQGPKDLTDTRDIYENNANQGARRVREAIFAVLPPWFVEDAKELCVQTLKDGGGVPLPKRIAKAIEQFQAMDVTQEQLEERVGRESGRWTEHDVAQLGITYRSLERGEIRFEEEFPEPERRVTAADITARARSAKKATTPQDGPGPTDEEIAAMNAEAREQEAGQ